LPFSDLPILFEQEIMKVYLDTIGCRLNQSEIESMALQFRAAGHEIVALPEQADLAVVNTCAVTISAAADSRAKLRQIARSGVDQIAATGCWVTLQPKQAGALPNVRYVILNESKEQFVPTLLGIPEDEPEREPLAREPLPGIRQRTRAFIKVQDGCDNRCTFCITTVARGPGRSRPVKDVVGDVQSALQGGTREVVLTGVHLGSWGQEWGGHLRDLVRSILGDTDIQRLRLSSLEPWDLDDRFFELWEDQRLCQHLHLPLQSGCGATLRRMARKTRPASYRELVFAARQVMPEVAITTDVIAGFPGETETEFAKSLEFVREMGFAGGHAFTYSPRPGTAAAGMPGQVSLPVRKQRNAAYRQVFEEEANAYRQGFIGKETPVLWESKTQLDGRGWQVEGYSGNYLRVVSSAPEPLWNRISIVRLQAQESGKLTGRILSMV
jgi:threonylcarbamoyladenosine tRNA methylthiotransferase MtaB